MKHRQKVRFTGLGICFIIGAIITGFGFQYYYLPLIFGGIAIMVVNLVGWVSTLADG